MFLNVRLMSALIRCMCRPLVLTALLVTGRAGATTELRVGVYQKPPEVMFTNGRQAHGLAVDILEAIARQEGWHIRYVPGTFQEGLSRLQDGRVDLLLDVARTDQRGRSMRFGTEAAIHTWSQLYAGKGRDIEKLADLGSKRIAVVAGSRQEQLIRKVAEQLHFTPALVLSPDFGSSIEAARTGKADAAVTNTLSGRWIASEVGLRDTGLVFGVMDLYFAGSPGLSPRVLDAIDLDLRKMKEDPDSAYFDAMRRWTRPQQFHWPPWLTAAICAGALVAVISAAWALWLRRYARRLEASEEAQRQYCRQVESANRELEAFCSAVSHDLRMPLVAMRVLLTSILKKEVAQVDADVRNCAERALDAVAEMRQLIAGLLAASQVGSEPLERESTDLSELARAVIEELQLADPGRSVGVEIARGMVACADTRLARQALANLLSNAWKFTKPRPQACIEFGRVEHEGTSWFFVRDNGVGFDVVSADLLFQPFQRYHDVAEFPGTGVGLATVQRILRRHGGSVWAESTPGDGACFYFTFEPLNSASAAPCRRLQMSLFHPKHRRTSRA